MASTIMFKFRSATTFEALALPGTSARLFDVKKAIVKAKKLDRVTNQLEFDLSVKNASTKEEYTDDTMLLPRGTRVIVQRLPAAKGHGLLSRIARDDFNGNNHVAYGNKTAAKNGFYEFTSREEDEEDEFEDAAADEMAALKAVTDQAMYNTTTSTSRQTTKPWTGTTGTSITVPPRGPSSNNNNKFHTHNHNKARPNADPELAKQERLLQQQQQPKKRPTGIPRTFLNSTTSSTTTAENNDTTKEEESALSRLQPIGFQALMGGKNSNNFNSNNTHDLEYALKVTSTIIPDHLQCAICKSVAKQAMLLPWDLEGHTTCESCIRDSLTQNGFVCPLTHQMGVSPDELLPNHGLRKAAELFIAQVMEDMDTVIQQQQRELKEQEEKIKKDIEDNVLEEETSSIVTKKSNKKLKQDEELGKENDLNGEDEFGGDVFDVAEEEKPPEEVKEEVEDTKVEIQKVIVKKEEPTIDDAPTNVPKPKDEDTEVKNTNETVPQKIPNFNNNNNNKFDSFPKQQQKQEKQEKQSRGPPQGYMIGPATTNNENAHDNSNRRGGAHSRGGGRNYMGNRAGRGGGSNRNRGGAGRGHNNDNNNNRFTSESQQSKNHHHHYRPTGRTYLNSQQQHQQDQRDGQKHRSSNGSDQKDHSAVDNVNKKRTRTESFDVYENKDDRSYQRHYNPRNNHRGSNNHGQDSYTRGDSYRRQQTNNHANSFNQRGDRGNGQDRFRNHNFRGRGRNYGYRDGNDYSRGRY